MVATRSVRPVSGIIDMVWLCPVPGTFDRVGTWGALFVFGTLNME